MRKVIPKITVPDLFDQKVDTRRHSYDRSIFILRSQGNDVCVFIFGRILTRFGVDRIPSYPIDFLPREFAACSEPPSRDNHRKASHPRAQ